MYFHTQKTGRFAKLCFDSAGIEFNGISVVYAANDVTGVFRIEQIALVKKLRSTND